MLSEDLKSMRADIAMLQECRLEQGILRLRGDAVEAPAGLADPPAPGEYIIISSGATEAGHYGVGIALSRRCTRVVRNVQYYNERVISVTLDTSPVPTTILSIYAPATTHDFDTRDAFWEEVRAIHRDVPGHHFLIYGGDFNTQLPRAHPLVGMYTKGAEGAAGVDSIPLSQLMIDLDLRAVNTYFRPARRRSTATFRSHLGESQIDFILTRRRHSAAWKWCRTRLATLHHSDHVPVAAGFQLALRRNRSSQPSPPPIDVQALQDPVTRLRYQDQLNTSLAALAPPVAWPAIKDAIHEAQKVLPTIPKRRFPWISNSTIQLALAYQRARIDKVPLEILRSARSQYKLAIKNDSVVRWTAFATRAQQAFEAHEHGSLFKDLRSFSGTRRAIPSVAPEDFANHLRSVLNGQNDGPPPPVWEPAMFTHTTAPSEAEVGIALKRLGRAKAPGPDAVRSELLAHGGPGLLAALTWVAAQFWTTGVPPLGAGTATVVPVYKKGPPHMASSYRPITLLQSIYKLLELILAARIKPILHIDEEQFGFRPNRSTLEPILALRNILQSRKEFQLESHCIAVDFTSAFDMVLRDEVWRELGEQAVPTHLILLCQRLMQGLSLSVATPFGTSSEILGTRGCPQGSSLGPTLFLLALQRVMRRVHERMGDWPAGIPLQHRRLCYLAYADDIILLAESHGMAQMMVDVLREEAAAAGLQINARKCQYLHSGTGAELAISINGFLLPPVDSIEYLGSMVGAAGESGVDLGHRIARAQFAFRRLAVCCFKQRGLPLKLRAQVYQWTVRQTLMYGTATWTAKEVERHGLDVCDRSLLRRMLPVRLRLIRGRVIAIKQANRLLYSSCCLQAVSTQLDERRWKLLRKIFLSDVTLPLECFLYEPSGATRQRGGQTLTWRRRIIRDAKALGMQGLHGVEGFISRTKRLSNHAFAEKVVLRSA